tara:strand:- start:147 stop:521 length:375 start_codon:yes stop_codon:yes gene_type:complete
MAGLSVKIPLQRDKTDGYKLNKTYQEMIKQNFKNLVLTIPGERIMDPLFGVGLRKYLFEQNSSVVREEISSNIYEQTKKYMPFINIDNIDFGQAEQIANMLFVRVEYSITPLSSQDSINIEIAA